MRVNHAGYMRKAALPDRVVVIKCDAGIVKSHLSQHTLHVFL